MKPKFTFEQHKELGRQLLAIHDQLACLLCRIDKAYPRTLGLSAKADKAYHAVDNLRCALDSQVFLDFPDRQAFPSRTLIDVYYNGSIESEEERMSIINSK